jgi:RND family efflux transporter MFP subunit
MLLLAGCGEQEPERAPDVIRPVKTAVVEGFAEGAQLFPGRVEAGTRMVVSFRVPGRIIELPIREGETIQKGQLIARLDPRDYAIAVSETKATFQRAEADFRRYQRLYETDAVPLADLDQRRSERDVAKARLEDAEKNLGYTKLRAPFTGMIGNRYVENFMDVQAQEQIVDLNDPSVIEVKINAAENLVAAIQRFQEQIELDIYAEYDAAPGQQYELQLKEIAARADPETQTFEATFIMPQPEDLNLLPGMTALVRVRTRIKPGATVELPITVPAIAVKTSPTGENIVWLVDPADMTVHATEVVVGQMHGTKDIVVRAGLSSGEHVVIAGLAQLRDGMKVRFWKEQEE